MSMDEVLTIGDNLYELSMIKMAKYGVLMGKLISEMSLLAWDTTKTNSENGVLAAIAKAIAVNKAEACKLHS